MSKKQNWWHCLIKATLFFLEFLLVMSEKTFITIIPVENNFVFVTDEPFTSSEIGISALHVKVSLLQREWRIL